MDFMRKDEDRIELPAHRAKPAVQNFGVKDTRWESWDFCNEMHLRRGGVLGDGLGPLGHGVLGELTGQDQADRRLYLARAERALLVIAHELAGLVGDIVEDVGDERVHDAHALGRDARVGMNLLEHLVDVDGVALAAALLLALLLLALSLGPWASSPWEPSPSWPWPLAAYLRNPFCLKVTATAGSRPIYSKKNILWGYTFFFERARMWFCR
jgi:hypothetical protein